MLLPLLVCPTIDHLKAQQPAWQQTRGRAENQSSPRLTGWLFKQRLACLRQDINLSTCPSTRAHPSCSSGRMLCAAGSVIS
jgi:hypothetical protein